LVHRLDFPIFIISGWRFYNRRPRRPRLEWPW
jgi:hypothetical protein